MLRTAVRRAGLLTGAAGAAYAYRAYKDRLPEKFVLELDFSTLTLVEKSPKLPQQLAASAKGQEAMLIRDATAAIRTASSDPRVSGLVARLGNGENLSLAMTQELLAAVQEFRERKAEAPTFAYASQYQSTSQYLLASGFGAVYQHPGVPLRLPSLSMEMPFFAGLLAKWGLRFEVITEGAYKSGFAALSDRSPSRAHRQQAESLLSSSYSQLISAVAAGRHLTEKQVRKLCRAHGSLSSADAQKQKLLDGTAYLDELDELVESKCSTDARQSVAAYHRKHGVEASLARRVKASSDFASDVGAAVQESAVQGAAAATIGAQSFASTASLTAKSFGSTVHSTVEAAIQPPPVVAEAAARAKAAEAELAEATAAAKVAQAKASSSWVAWPMSRSKRRAAEAEAAASVAAASCERASQEAAKLEASHWLTVLLSAKYEAAFGRASDGSGGGATVGATAGDSSEADSHSPLASTIENDEAEDEPDHKPASSPSASPASSSLLARISAGLQSRPTIGVICLQGPIMPSPASTDVGSVQRSAISPRQVRSQLRAARDDPSVKAVVLRIDSPGGEAVASEQIWREVQLLRKAGKPVVASMGACSSPRPVRDARCVLCALCCVLCALC